MSRAPGLTKRAPRVSVEQPAVLLDAQGNAMDVLMLDVSVGGFRMRVPEMPRIGEHVTLRIDGYEDFPAQIRWALGDEAGGGFLSPFEPEGDEMPLALRPGAEDERPGD